VGPVPIYIDDSHKTIDEPYSILSYIEGNHVKKWTDKRLKLHATKLAKLHQKRFTRHSRGKTFSLYNRLLNEIKGYTSKEFNNKNIKLLMPLVKEFIKSNDRIFTELKSFSRVHTDLCLTNILINNNDLFYIDWEYSMIEDNAYDISKLYFTDIAVSPWSIKLNKIKERIFINQYLKQIKFKDNTLRKRVHLWHIYILFTDSLYCKWKLNNYSNEKAAFPKKVYQKSLDFMIGSLKKKLIKN
jgi:thiamine kinase-like enzyme